MTTHFFRESPAAHYRCFPYGKGKVGPFPLHSSVFSHRSRNLQRQPGCKWHGTEASSSTYCQGRSWFSLSGHECTPSQHIDGRLFSFLLHQCMAQKKPGVNGQEKPDQVSDAKMMRWRRQNKSVEITEDYHPASAGGLNTFSFKSSCVGRKILSNTRSWYLGKKNLRPFSGAKTYFLGVWT